jgi:Ca2+-binding RTX toxin-like protein
LSGGDGDDILSNAENERGGYTTSKKDFDVFDGGAGNDSFRMSRLFDITASHFLGGAGTDDITLGGDISHMIIKDIEILNSGHGRDSIRVDADVLDSFEQIFLRSRKYEIEFSTGGDFTWKDGSQEANVGVLRGSGQSDHIDLSATEGDWKINAGDGKDTIATGGGISYVGGGLGRDIFVIGNTGGKTAIMDFATGGKDQDRIDLSDIDAVTSFEDLIDHHIRSEGGWLYMQLGKTEIALLDVDRSDLAESGFIF